jgi:hypothetical protein
VRSAAASITTNAVGVLPEQLGSRESFLCDHRRPSNLQVDKMEYALAQSIRPLLTIFSIRLIDAGLIFEAVLD